MILDIVFKSLKPGELIETVVFTLMGLIIFGLAIWIMDKVVPFSIRKEIEDDQNTALGIIMGSVIIGIAMILSAVMRAP